MILLAQVAPSFASPPSYPEAPRVITTYFVFPAGREPDIKGNFEVEIYCATRFPIEKITVQLGLSPEITVTSADEIITVDQTLELFKGSLQPEETKVWRLKGILNIPVTKEAQKFPSSIVLYVSYIFPYDAVIQSIKQNSELSPTDRKQLLMRLNDEAGKKKRTIIKALPVYRSGENS